MSSEDKAKAREKLRLIREKNELLDVLKSKSGRSLMWRILSYCGLYQTMSGEINDCYRQVGKRDVALYLMGVMSDADEEAVFKMMKEAKVRQTAEDLKLDIEDDMYAQEEKHLSTNLMI